MKKIRWGVLSTANIGLEKVIPAMQKGEYCEMAAIASQSLERGKAAVSNCLNQVELLIDCLKCINAVFLTAGQCARKWQGILAEKGNYIFIQKILSKSSAMTRYFIFTLSGEQATKTKSGLPHSTVRQSVWDQEEWKLGSRPV